MLTRLEAIRRLTRRYQEQCERFPLMPRDISLDLYVASNVGIVMKRELLASYASFERSAPNAAP